MSADARRRRTRSQATLSAIPSASGATFAFTSPRVGRALRRRNRASACRSGASDSPVRVKPRAGRE